MGKYSVEQLKQCHASADFGKDTLANSTLLGCCYCLKTYTPDSIAKDLVAQEWSGEGIIWCPHCEIDLVISDNGTGEIDPQLLLEMRNHYFVQPSDFEAFHNLKEGETLKLPNGKNAVFGRVTFIDEEIDEDGL